MDREKHLETILVLVLALGVIHWFNGVNGFLSAAGILGLIGLFIPYLAGKIHFLWMKLAQAIGFVMSKVLLSIVYFLVVLPLSLLSKLFGMKNGIRLKPGGESHFIVRDFIYTRESLEDTW